MTTVIRNKYHENSDDGIVEMKQHLVQNFSEPSRLTMPGTQIPLHAQSGIELLTLEKMTGVTKAKRIQQTRSFYRDLQIKIFNLLERPRTGMAALYHAAVFLLILGSLFLSVIVTMNDFETDLSVLNAVYYLEIFLVIVFTMEYILRVWSCSSHGNYKGFWGKMRFIKRPYMVIDIIVIVATTVVVATTTQSNKSNYFSVSVFRFLRFLQVLRILRLDRQRGAFKIVSHVVYEHRQELLTCYYMSFILLVACSFLVYLAEKSDEQPDNDNQMKDLGDGMYFAIITLLTVGYGDISPQNWVAKILTCLFAFVGTAFFALPAGILGSGFALQVAQNKKQKHFNRRRFPAALVIQYTWKWFAANHHSDRFPATWIPHQMLSFPKEKKYSVYSRSPGATPIPGRRSVFHLRKKFQSGRNYTYQEGDLYNSRRSSIGATIPSALELRDRCQSEGNLLLVGPHSVEDNQATIVSLPPGYRESLLDARCSGLYHSTQDIQFKPLTEEERNVIRFIRKIKFRVAISKFKEECRPYDVKDVIEQYTEGQMEMFGFIKKFQLRLETTLGIRESEVIDPSRTLHARLNAMENKVDSLDTKLDVVIQLLKHKRHHNHNNGGHDRRDHNNGQEITPDNPYSDNETGNDSVNGHISSPRDRRRGMTFHADEVSRRLERLIYESTDSSLTGSERNLRVPGDTGRRPSSRFTVTTPVDILLQRSDAIDIDSAANSQRSSASSLALRDERAESVPLGSQCVLRSSKRMVDETAVKQNSLPRRKCRNCATKSLSNISDYNSQLEEMTLNYSKSVPQLHVSHVDAATYGILTDVNEESKDSAAAIPEEQVGTEKERGASLQLPESSDTLKVDKTQNDGSKEHLMNGHLTSPGDAFVGNTHSSSVTSVRIDDENSDTQNLTTDNNVMV